MTLGVFLEAIEHAGGAFFVSCGYTRIPVAITCVKAR
jgi:hypothetical protein